MSSVLMISCNRNLSKYDVVPDWAKDVIWYQIFPERFCNGDPSNDPTIETLDGTWPYDKQSEWHITPWTSDWYKLQPWEESNARGFYYNAQLRRYGGDIQGIIDKLDYLEELGINAIYLNPVFESASSHKYGTTMYHHIDNNFGPNPKGDIEIWNSETPDDPLTWRWTSADKLFLKLIEEVHSRGMKIIIDGVFNHVGIPFWAFQDVKKKGRQSKYLDWFIINSFDKPDTPKDEFEYQGWYGVTDLPEIWENENGPRQSFREHIQNIVKRWGDPNSDGDPSDGVDGWRLDVAEMVRKEFWRDFRKWVRDVNPEAYLTGEVWWEDFHNNVMFNAAPWLQGDVFDAVMNYRFADAMLKAFVDQKDQISPSQLDQMLGNVREIYPKENQSVLLDLMASHDTERFASMIINPDRWIDHASNLNYDKDFKVRKPTEIERKVQKAILVFQFTYVGAPYIYYGDEVGMWGADDPDCRKPMVWSDYQYEPETHHPFGVERPTDIVEIDEDLFQFYKSIIKLRKENESIRRGKYRTVLIDDDRSLFAFERWTDSEKIRAIFNMSENTQEIQIDELLPSQEKWELIMGDDGKKNILKAKSARVYKSL
ncbi:MAG: glycoside hydrolase family 13 protein [Candidatus Marinimicrobia bacterium]|nr:glycoside hydrolase family 13 protein [Candidatus Neomarinimicrobiota bacterium]